MANEVLELANQVANAKIDDDFIRAMVTVERVQRNGGSRKLIRKVVDEVNSRIDMAIAGSFDCTHYSVDDCGCIVPPDVGVRKPNGNNPKV